MSNQQHELSVIFILYNQRTWGVEVAGGGVAWPGGGGKGARGGVISISAGCLLTPGNIDGGGGGGGPENTTKTSMRSTVRRVRYLLQVNTKGERYSVQLPHVKNTESRKESLYFHIGNLNRCAALTVAFMIVFSRFLKEFRESTVWMIHLPFTFS